jgi:hypothetical protein
MANSKKLANRLRAGDRDPNQQTVSTDTTSGIPTDLNQPLPGQPQGPGNMLGNQLNYLSAGSGVQPQRSIDPKATQSMYGDPVFDNEQFKQLGAVGFALNSGKNGNQVPGQRLNSMDYGAAIQPKEGQSMEMLNVYYAGSSANKTAERLYASFGDVTPSYAIGAMGPMGISADSNMQGALNRGQMPTQMLMQSDQALPLQGVMTTQSLNSSGPEVMGPGNTGSLGMSTGPGGGRNKRSNQTA